MLVEFKAYHFTHSCGDAATANSGSCYIYDDGHDGSHSKLRLVYGYGVHIYMCYILAYSPILDAQERPQTSLGKLAAFRYVHVFRCSRLVYSVRTRPASNCWTEILQCDRQSDQSSASFSSSDGATIREEIN